MLGSGETVKFIQLDIFGHDVGDDFLIGGDGLLRGAPDPALDRGRMNSLDAGDGLRRQAFESLMDGVLDFLLGRLEVVESGAEAVAESSATVTAAKDHHSLSALEPIAAVVS
jgi:hypothetical protein